MDSNSRVTVACLLFKKTKKQKKQVIDICKTTICIIIYDMTFKLLAQTTLVLTIVSREMTVCKFPDVGKFTKKKDGKI